MAAASATTFASATVSATGFSSSTCFPAASSATAISLWVGVGVQTETYLTSASLMITSKSEMYLAFEATGTEPSFGRGVQIYLIESACPALAQAAA
ncbi:unannotated protein [freshwater metagenome]|uniref:Unannotated protein n=1 Tax=freshwater metagenome TaxID=449393 RepID=A0A6J6UI36_9ZZZZ